MKNGGPAFPRAAGHNGLNGIEEHASNEPQDGMTLRDYFAAHAPQPPDSWHGGEWKRGISAKSIAAWNYYYADAMLKARETA